MLIIQVLLLRRQSLEIWK